MRNKQPVDYKQYDSKWANVKYCGSGETDKTIQSSGCGPTCAAMVIATLKDKAVTPVDTCAWSAAHGYKYANQGTAYSYFVPQLKAYNISCKQLSSSRILNQPDNAMHDQAKEYVQGGYWAIALMGTKADGSRGTWTSGGHYVLVWDWDSKVRINDPIHASGNNKYCNGDESTFRDECRNYWIVDARAYNGRRVSAPKDVSYRGIVNTSSQALNYRDEPSGTVIGKYPKGTVVTVTKELDGWGFTGDGWVDLTYIKAVEEDEDMDVNRFRELWLEMRSGLQDNDAGAWSQEARDWAVGNGLIQGSSNGELNGMWEDLMTREQLVTVLYRFAQIIGKA